MNPTSEPSQEGNRFAALLNPIRDIAASWGIDVAKELSEYAESLGIDINQTSITNENAESLSVPVDFTEAALLVQGSTTIYSRKVEHLYSLVYVAVSTMNQMRGKGKGGANGGEDSGGTDADADALLNIDEEDFLTLDDNIPQADPKTITLASRTTGRDETLLPPIPPMLAHASAAASEHPGSVKYKMTTARFHSSGALIMQGCPPVNENLDALPEDQNPSQEHPDVTQPFDNGFDDVDDFGGEDDTGLMSPAGNAMDSEKPSDFPADDNCRTPLAGSRTIKETAALYGITSSRDSKNRTKPVKDPFLTLDPHNEIPGMVKPLKVGKTYRKLRPKTEAKKKTTTYYSEVPQGKSIFDIVIPDIPPSATVRTYVSFQGIKQPYAIVLRKRSTLLRQRILREKGLHDMSIEPSIEDENIENLVDTDPYAGDFDNDFDQDDDAVIESPEQLRLPDGLGIRDDDPDLGLFADPSHELQLTSQLEYLASSYEETCRKHLEKTAWMWEKRTTDVDLIRRVDEWTTRIQPLLEEEEKRKDFDISAYGDSVLNRLDDLTIREGGDETSIHKLLQQPARYEISRLFLATLQLANNHALEIVPPETCSVSDFMVKRVLNRSNAKENYDDLSSPAAKNSESTRLKRSRVAGNTPKSARREPLRPRLQQQSSVD